MKLLIFRTILIYLCVLFAMRLMGKRQLGELQPEELVSTILISNLASISIESEDVPVTASLIPLFLIAALELLGSALSFRSQKFFNLLSGRPKTVILNGEIDQNALRTLRLTVADLMRCAARTSLIRGMCPTRSLRRTGLFRWHCGRKRNLRGCPICSCGWSTATQPSPLCWMGRCSRTTCTGAAKTVPGWNARRRPIPCCRRKSCFLSAMRPRTIFF